ncbi:MAG: hypothetical protein OHK0011_23260 [Turneriella sp.]
MFEAIYLGKKVELYPVSEYHKELAQDFVVRLARQKDLLSALDGSGSIRLRQIIMRALKGDIPKP